MLEARDRVGGRVWSTTLPNGAVVERGGEFVLPGYEAVRSLASRLGLELQEKGTLYGDREPRGGPPVTRAELAAAVASLSLGAARGVSAAEALAGVPAGAREAIAARLAVSTAHELDDQPASVLADGAAGFGAFPSHGVAGGNDRLAHALAEGLDVRLGATVGRIRRRPGGVDVDGVAADVCVVTAPAPATLAIAFDPPLPAWKRAALAAVSYGHAAKLFLELAEPVAPSQTLSVPGRFWTWTQHGVPAASSFAGTASALSRLRVADGASRWADEVRRLRPDLPYAGGEPLLVTWPEGAYSARSLRSPLDDEALRLPVGPLHFAGEHTAAEWHALMEGALRSGARAAAAVVAGG